MGLYRIAWQVLSTGFSGHGQYCMSKECAEANVVKLNLAHPDVNHWIEEEG